MDSCEAHLMDPAMPPPAAPILVPASPAGIVVASPVVPSPKPPTPKPPSANKDEPTKTVAAELMPSASTPVEPPPAPVEAKEEEEELAEEGSLGVALDIDGDDEAALTAALIAAGDTPAAAAAKVVNAKRAWTEVRARTRPDGSSRWLHAPTETSYPS